MPIGKRIGRRVYLCVYTRAQPKRMLEFVKDVLDLRSPEEKLQLANERISVERRNLRREKMRKEIEIEDAEKECQKSAVKNNRRVLEKDAMKVVKLQKGLTVLERREERLEKCKNTVDDIRCAALEVDTVVLAMEASSATTVDPNYVAGVIWNYERSKGVNKEVREIINEAMEGNSSEELEADGALLTPDERQHVDEIIRDNMIQANQKFINTIPSINGTKVSSSILYMNEKELAAKNTENEKKMEEFMSS